MKCTALTGLHSNWYIGSAKITRGSANKGGHMWKGLHGERMIGGFPSHWVGVRVGTPEKILNLNMLSGEF